MTPEQKKLVQTSFEKIVPISETAGKLFYNRLVELDPGLRPLFSVTLEEQGRKLMDVLKIAIRNLDHLDQLIPAVEALGARHAGYNVKPEHYDTGGAALIWTLEQGLGEDFTPETREAWVTVYKVLTDTMKAAAENYIAA
jgi:hemoglobin-like flavoprotein